MTDEAIAISDAYRSSRRNTSILCGIGIAWSAAQFEIDSISLPSIGDVKFSSASIPILIGAMCIYAMVRNTLEYMMQSKPARRAPLAKVDYIITIYLVRFTIAVLAASVITRSWGTVLYIAAVFLIALVSFFIIAFGLGYILMPLRMWIRSLSGRRSVAWAAIEAISYSFAFSWLALVFLIVLMGFNIFNPFVYLGDDYAAISVGQLAAFSIVCLVILLSFFFDEKFLGMVFAYVPVMITRTYKENGREVFSREPNPNHPDYEKYKDRQPFVYSKLRPGEEDIGLSNKDHD